MNYILRSSKPGEAISKEIVLAPGINSFCVDKYGTYDLSFSSCHTYDSSTSKSFKTGNESPVAIKAVKHRNGVQILSNIKSTFKASIESEGHPKRIVTFVEEPNKVNNQFAYRYDFDLQPYERWTVTPESDIVLFSPQSTELIGANDCVEVSITRRLCLSSQSSHVFCKLNYFRLHSRSMPPKV